MFHPPCWFPMFQYPTAWSEQNINLEPFNVHHECKWQPRTSMLIIHSSGCQVTTHISRNSEGSGPCSKQPTAVPDCVPCCSESLFSCLILNISIRWRWSRFYASAALPLAGLLARSQYPEGPATGQVFLGFPVSKSECWDGSQHSKLLLHASHVALRT
jgi:hypothetical protein